ncbi:MAG: DUF4157 domain-containing protein [Methanothrix sp.]|nr:DUF4157 domain-containing protein [Methanothrix sp.]
MKESAASEKKTASASVQRKAGVSSPVFDEPGAGNGPLMNIVQRIGCSRCAPALASLAGRMAGMPAGSRKEAALSLQRAKGNRFVQGMAVQAKLMVGPADDQYESEADRVAEQVMRTPETVALHRLVEEEEEEKIQAKPLAKRITPLVQRKIEEKEKLQTKSLIQRVGSEVGGAAADLQRSLAQARGNGRPLADMVRSRMEGAFGVDFSSVRVHSDAQADRLSRSIQARAFTRGQDIFLRQGEYRPESSEGQRLLAHELTHVVQQKKGSIQRNMIQRVILHSPKSGEKGQDFDPNENAFKYWLAALVRRQDKKKEVIDKDWIKTQIINWCIYRKEDKMMVTDSHLEQVGKWYFDEHNYAKNQIWDRIPDEGVTKDQFVEILESLPEARNENAQKLILMIKEFVFPADSIPAIKGLRIRKATIPIHLTITSSLDQRSTNWAPTGAFTGGGGIGLGGKPMPVNIMVSTGLCNIKDIVPAVLYEFHNAKNWGELEGIRLSMEQQQALDKQEEKARKISGVEYKSDKEYNQTLRVAFVCRDESELCEKLGIKDPDLYKPVKQGNAVEIPSQITDVEQRRAIWWAKTMGWSEEVRKKSWVDREHGGGMKSSSTMYVPKR